MSAAFPGRSLIIGSPAFLPRLPQWLQWAADHGLNTVFFHTDPPGGGVGGAIPHRTWRAVRDEAMALAATHGMVVEVGGHGLRDLLPRSRFADQPDAFRMVDGARTPDRNLCPSSPAALDALRQGIKEYAAAEPGVAVYHVWPDDLPGGGWCSCPACEGLSPSDQSFRATAAMAEGLAEARPDAQLSWLAYHDTEDAPDGVPPPNVCLLWAPRRRCFGHDLGDPACPVNQPRYTSRFAALAAAFEGAGAAPTRVFEYWLDAILFKSVWPVFPRIGGDLRSYRDAGVHTVGALLVGPRDVRGAWPAAALFARTAHDPDTPASAVLDQADPGNRDALLDLGEAMALALQLEPPGEPVPELARIAAVPGAFADVEDPINASADALGLIEERHNRAVNLAERAVARLRGSDCEPEAQATLRWLRFAHWRVAAYLAVAQGDRAAAHRAVDRLAEAYADFLAWADDDRVTRMHDLFWGKRVEALRDFCRN